MRYLTTTQPPAAITSDYGLQIEHAPPIFVLENAETPEAAGLKLADDIGRAVRAGASAVTLRNVMREGDAWGGEIWDDNGGYLWWQRCLTTAWESLSRMTDTLDALDAVAIDHARYTDWTSPDEKQWQREFAVVPLEQLEIRVGMYGHHDHSPTVWTDAAAYRNMRFDGLDRPDTIPWLIMPGQWRQNGGPVSTAEFVGVIDMLDRYGFDCVCVWSDPRKDAMGNPKTRPQDWHAFLTAATLMSGRVVDVRKYQPPSWLPTIDEPSPAGVFGGGA